MLYGGDPAAHRGKPCFAWLIDAYHELRSGWSSDNGMIHVNVQGSMSFAHLLEACLESYNCMSIVLRDKEKPPMVIFRNRSFQKAHRVLSFCHEAEQPFRLAGVAIHSLAGS